MANTIDKVYSDVKNQLAKFLANQLILINLNKKINSISDFNLKTALQKQHNKLYENQKNIEQQAMSWISKVADFKTALEQEAKSDMGFYNLFTNIKAITGEGLNYLQEGIKLTTLMLNQNSQVENLSKSVEAQKIIEPKDETFIKIIYGFIGILTLTYILKRKKK